MKNDSIPIIVDSKAPKPTVDDIKALIEKKLADMYNIETWKGVFAKALKYEKQYGNG